MGYPECCVANPVPTRERSEHDGHQTEYDEQDVGHVEADGRVSGDSVVKVHAVLMRRTECLFPDGLAVHENFQRIRAAAPDGS